ncbi:MAG: tetratricopeptide repeat protein [bacterium]
MLEAHAHARAAQQAAPGWPPRVGLAAAFLLLAFLAYGPALHAPFDFDDREAIVENTTIGSLLPTPGPLRTPPLGTAVSGRPVANYSFALNHAIAEVTAAGDNPFGYHIANIALHVLAALVLCALIRWTIVFGGVPADWHSAANGIAVVTSAIWLVHPIQTEAVDYLSQRTEILVSLCYLTTLYASARAWQANQPRLVGAAPGVLGVRGWSIIAVVACVLGMGSKEVMLTAPVMVVLYDRAFLAPNWRTLWRARARRWLYLSLVGTMLVSIALVAAGARGDTAGTGAGVTWYAYLYTQGWAIGHYVRLVFWPVDLAFDYGRALVHGATAIPGLIGLSAAGIATLAAWRRPSLQWLAFLGTFFFLLLAPSSSVVPIRTEVAAERRIYLASAVIIALTVISVEYARRRFLARRGSVPLLSAALVVVALLTMVSAGRSAQYTNLVDRWTDAVRVTPANGRAYDNLASALLRADPPRVNAADSVLRLAMAVDPTFVPAWTRSATIAMAEQRLPDAQALLEHALRLRPGDAAATEALGNVFVMQKRPDLALPYLLQFAAFHPGGKSYTSVGLAYLMKRQVDSAIVALTRAAAIDPARVDARRYLASALVEQGRGPEALPYIEQAIRLDTISATTFGLLALAQAQASQGELALRAAAQAVALAPESPVVLVLAGRAAQTMGNFTKASEYFVRAIVADGNDVQAIARLGEVEASRGNETEATRLFRRALELVPGYPLATRGLERLKH